jgi:hypothetical protein
MVIYFNKRDLVSFGNYLSSDERRKSFEKHPNPPKDWSLEQRLAVTSKEDIDNWMAGLKK